MTEAFKIIEPSGKTYRVFADGRVEGFEPGALVCNRIPALIASAKAGSFLKLCRDIARESGQEKAPMA